jgi:hypothetical protein
MDDRSSPAAGNAVSAPDKGTRRYLWAVLCAWAIVLLVICIRVGISPTRQSVYTADYVTAGWRWLHGQEIYSGNRHFVYSPLAAVAFTPIAVFPLRLSNVLWRLICGVALLLTANAWLRSGISGLGDVRPPARFSASMTTGLLLMLPLAAGNLNIGQLNVAVLVVTAIGVLAVREHYWNTAAILLAGLGFMKIYPLAIGMLLAWLYPRQLSWRLVLALAALFLLSLGLQRPAYAWSEYKHWAATLGADDRLDIDLYSSWRDFGFLVRACNIPLPDQAYRVMEVTAGGALALFLWLGKQRWGWTETRLLGGVFSLGCAWMLLFGPATEAATYVVLSLPLCAALIAAWELPPASPGGSRMRGFALVFAISYVLVLVADFANSWAHSGTHHLYMRALQPIGALIFTAGVVCWLMRSPAPEASIPTD